MSARWIAFLFCSTLLTVVLATPASAGPKPERQPNVIVIVADDLGSADLGCQGCQDIPTPNIDSLARNGVRCTNGYVSCPVCSPTRAGLLTGRYQQRFGHEFNPGPAQKAAAGFGLPLTERTLANLLRDRGYATGLVGKWHLGYAGKYVPTERGFDQFFGFLGGAHSYVDAKADSANPIMRGTKAVDEKEYLTDAITREAVSFLDGQHKKPFFLMVTFNAVHAPMQGAQKYLDRFKNVKEDKRRTFSAMLSAMDDGVGAILAKLRELKVEDDTIIFFISDNGGPTAVNSSRNTPLRGFKGSTWEGGVRVPFLVQWKGKLPAGKVYDKPVIALDILPTAVAASGGQPPEKLDGVNLLPYLAGKKEGVPHDALYWRFGQQWAIRKGDWKLTQAAQGEMELHDLSKDVEQKKDLTKERPEVVKELREAYAKWDAELAKPLWGKGGKKKGAGVLSPVQFVTQVEQKEQPPKQPSKREWEFRAVFFGGLTTGAMTQKLNELADEGWEYVGPLTDTAVAFRRRLAPVALEDASKKEIEKLQGTWYTVATEEAGQQLGGENKADKHIFAGNKWIHKEDGENVKQEGTYKIVAVGPKLVQIDFLVAEGFQKGENWTAVYGFEGETLRWCGCYASSGRPRPTALVTRDGDGYFLRAVRKEK